MEENRSTGSKETNKIFLDAPIIGGAVMAVLSLTPIISLFNLFCCMWLIGGGVISYMYASKKEDYIPRPTDGLLYGVLAGIFGWIINLVLGFLMFSIKVNKFNLIKEKLSKIGGPEADKIIQIISNFGVFGFFFVINLIFIIFYLVFPTIGGAIAQSLTKKKSKKPEEVNKNNELQD